MTKVRQVGQEESWDEQGSSQTQGEKESVWMLEAKAGLGGPEMLFALKGEKLGSKSLISIQTGQPCEGQQKVHF